MPRARHKAQPVSELRLGIDSKNSLDGGLCLDQESSINLSQSPYGGLLNMCLDDGGTPISRPGQGNLHNTSLGAGGINGLYESYHGKTIFAWGTGLYSQSGLNDPILIYSGITSGKAFFFVYNSMLYMLNGHEYLQYDGTTVSVVTPYVPRTSYNRKPDGSGGTTDQSWNLIGTGFRNDFTGDGTSKDFMLQYQNLDATTIIITVNGVIKVEGTDFTVDRVAGKVTFTTAPADGGTLNPNNVQITAHKTFAGYKEQIFNCTFATEYSSVMFLSGNVNIKNTYWAGGVTADVTASYFPLNRVYQYGGNDKSVTAFKVSYGTLIVWKEDRFASVSPVTSPVDGTTTFNRQDLNTEIGCDMPGTMQIIQNRPVWANSYAGVFMLNSSLVAGEKNADQIGLNILGDTERNGLLQENTDDLKGATSFDNNYQYGIVLANGKGYVWEYLRGYSISNMKSMKWYLWDNIQGRYFFIRDNVLCYSHRDRGQLCRFIDALNDFGAAINKIFSMKLYDFSSPEWEKFIDRVYVTTRANSNSSIAVTYVDDQNETVENEIIPSTETKSLDLSDIDYSNWVWSSQTFAPTIPLRPGLQGIRYLKIQLSNNVYNENLSVLCIVITFKLTRMVR